MTRHSTILDFVCSSPRSGLWWTPTVALYLTPLQSASMQLLSHRWWVCSVISSVKIRIAQRWRLLVFIALSALSNSALSCRDALVVCSNGSSAPWSPAQHSSSITSVLLKKDNIVCVMPKVSRLPHGRHWRVCLGSGLVMWDSTFSSRFAMVMCDFLGFVTGHALCEKVVILWKAFKNMFGLCQSLKQVLRLFGATAADGGFTVRTVDGIAPPGGQCFGRWNAIWVKLPSFLLPWDLWRLYVLHPPARPILYCGITP